MASREPKFLYLTTTGRLSGQSREIEIWFTQQGENFYVISYLYERAHWVRNIQRDPRVRVRVGERQFEARARILNCSRTSQLCEAVQKLSEAKYGWSDGLIVELDSQHHPQTVPPVQ